MDIYFGIDGTNHNDSAADTSATAPLQLTSYVKRIGLLNFDSHTYRAGTEAALTGYGSAGLGEEAADWVMMKRRTAPDPAKVRVFLGGFSRGGASVLLACKRLNQNNIAIQGLFLFDAVDRTASIGLLTARKVPDNVINTYHAYRDPSADSRPEFDNCGMRGSPGKYTKRAFYCTHGGMGGWRLGSDQLREPLVPKNTMGTLAHRQPARPAVQPAFGDLRYHEAYSPNPTTNVSAMQQLSGSLAVWTWMQGNVLAARSATCQFHI